MQLRATAFRQLPFAGALLLLTVLVGLAAVYWVSIDEQRQYLTSRNFRILAVLGTQTQNLLANQARMLRDEIRYRSPQSEQPAVWLDAMRRSASRDLTRVSIATSPMTSSQVRKAIDEYQTSVLAEGRLLRLTFAAPTRGLPEIRAHLAASSVLDAVFGPKLQQGAFDTLVLAGADGRVVFATGRRAQEVQAMSLDALLPAPVAGTTPAVDGLGTTVAAHDVTVAGTDYRMFVQPCCRLGPDTPGRAARRAAPPADGLIVAGLVESAALRSASLAISPVLVLSGILLLLVAAVAWPFLKLTFMGAQQRVTPFDVIEIGAGSVFGLALATIVLLTTSAYARLAADLDEQLEALADRIKVGMHTEIVQASLQAQQMTNTVLALPCAATLAPSAQAWVAADAVMCRDLVQALAPAAAALSNPYPGYSTFALINSEGLQALKVTAGAASRTIDVGERPYFRIAKDRTWPIRDCVDGCVVESVWSWTRGTPQAVVSRHTGRGDDGAPIHPGLPVAALGIPMRSLIAPVLPPGFEFAVINPAGDVLFHSDAQRNVHENLILETDGNRRLRAIVSARSAGPASTSYWGRPYRAYVLPADVPGWTIVTLADKQHMRGLVLEWTSVSLLFLGVLVTLWIVAMLTALYFGASWVWPDPLRRPRYQLLSCLYLVLIGLFGAVALLDGTRALLVTGFAFPVLAWAATAAALVRRPTAAEDDTAGSALQWDYTVMGVLFLVLTAMVPGAAFFARSYDLHIESYLKHRQIGLAHRLSERAPWRPDTATPRHPLANAGLYGDFFYGTEIGRSNPADWPPRPPGRSTVHHDMVLSLLEDYLPYYTELSVEMRELLHERSHDSTWASERPVPERIRTLVAASSTAGWRLTSSVPTPVSILTTAGDEPPRVVLSALVALALIPGVAWLACPVVAYMRRHVFLSQVVEARPAARLVVRVGDNLLLRGNPISMAKRFKDAEMVELHPIVTSVDAVEAWRAATLLLKTTGPGCPVVVTDLDKALDKTDVTHHKLALIEDLASGAARTVVVLTAHSPVALIKYGRRPDTETVDGARWEALLDTFVAIDRRGAPHSDRADVELVFELVFERRRTSSWREWVTGGGWLPWVDVAGASPWREALLAQEGSANRVLRGVCYEIYNSETFEEGTLTEEQLLDEIENRALASYEKEWAACTEEQRVVLQHVAQYGLTSEASRHVVRQLLKKRLLRKDPELRLMNRTFRSFVLSPGRRAEVISLEGLAEPSVWDRVRLPLALAAAAAAIFLFSTQREMFNTTLTAVAGVSTAVPAIVKLLAQVTTRGKAVDGGAANT